MAKIMNVYKHKNGDYIFCEQKEDGEHYVGETRLFLWDLLLRH